MGWFWPTPVNLTAPGVRLFALTPRLRGLLAVSLGLIIGGALANALDRVLLWNCYLVPQFAAGFERAARWDRFSRPDPLPKYGVTGFPSLWWYDADKAAKIKRS